MDSGVGEQKEACQQEGTARSTAWGLGFRDQRLFFGIK